MERQVAPDHCDPRVEDATVEQHVAPGQRQRGRKPAFADIVSLNSSGWPQLEAAMDHYRPGRGSDLHDGVQVAALLTQEDHAVGDRWVTSNTKPNGVHGT